jgi:hypothetical protein
MRVTLLPPVSGDAAAALAIVAQAIRDRDGRSRGARAPDLPGQADHEQNEQSEVEDPAVWTIPSGVRLMEISDLEGRGEFISTGAAARGGRRVVITARREGAGAMGQDCSRIDEREDGRWRSFDAAARATTYGVGSVT